MSSAALPAVSVILPVRNGMPHLPEAVASVLAQDHPDLELVVLDDGSTDGTADYLRSVRDPRLRVLRHEATGLVAALNALLEHASHDLVARMDADDRSRHDRLSRQARELVARPDVVAVGSCHVLVGPDGQSHHAVDVPVGSGYVRRALLLRNPLVHGSVMMRRRAVLEVGGYRADVGPVEDYDLWCRLSTMGELDSVPEELYEYRVSHDGVTRSAPDHQRRCSWAVRDAYREEVGWPELSGRVVATDGRRFATSTRARPAAAATRYCYDHLHLAQAALRAGRVALALRVVLGVLMVLGRYPSAIAALVPIAELRRARARARLDRLASSRAVGGPVSRRG